MKQFFKYTLASMLGIILASGLLSLISIGILAGVLSSFDKSEETKKIEENSILKLSLNRPIIDRASDNPLENFDFNSFESNKPLGLNDLIDNIEKAKEDENIKGIYLDLSSVASGMANLVELREALEDFKTSEKFILAYAENYTQGTYYLASVADEIYMFPEGGLEFKGLFTELSFFKNALEKLDIEMQVIRGKNNKFKSAVEPFLYEKMSDENRMQINMFLTAFWNEMLNSISDARGITVDKLQSIADNYTIRLPEDAVTNGFVDALKYKDEVEAILRAKTEKEEDEDLEYVSLGEYKKVPKHKVEGEDEEEKEKPWDKKDYVAVVYAAGEIRSGSSDAETLGSETVAKAIKEAAEDSTVKAIVFRVNSPGGSALASEVILREAIKAKAQKPFIVSMGNLAASGGYYISCKADKIFANETTITGSIGVFGLLPNVKGLMNNKLGITFDGVKTNRFADLGMPTDGLTDEEYSIIQESVEDVYSTFINHVAEGRGMPVERVDSIGQGRVWAGVDALEIGLVDELGGLNEALAYAVEAAELEDYKVKRFPKQEDPFKKFMKELDIETKAWLGQYVLGEEYKYYQWIQKAKETKGVQARLPYDIHLSY